MAAQQCLATQQQADAFGQVFLNYILPFSNAVVFGGGGCQ